MLLVTFLCILSAIGITYEQLSVPGAPCPNYQGGRCTYLQQCPASNQHGHCGANMNYKPLVCCTVNGKILRYYTARELPDRTQCGLAGLLNHVYNGDRTQIGEYPWMAALLYLATKHKTYGGVKCGGTLITEKFVLTAAHCVIDLTPESIRVLLGEWNTTSDPDPYIISRKCDMCTAKIEYADRVINATIDKIITHQHYSSETMLNDIGLLRLEKPVAFTDYVRPICLPSTDFPITKDTDDLFLAGWGTTETTRRSDVLLKARLNFLAADACLDRIQKVGNIHKTEFCAFNVNSDACGGDSGGPLIKSYKDKSTNWFQLGIVGSGFDCSIGATASVYTRVSSFVNWIIYHIKPEAERDSHCKTPDSKNGTCVLVSECPVLEQQYLQPRNSSEVELVRRSLCGYHKEDRSDLVCCSVSAIKRGNAMEGSSCKTPTSEPMDGKCVRLTNCPALKNASKAAHDHEHVLKSQCGFDDELLVCCKMQNIVVASEPKYLEDFLSASIPNRTICGHIEKDATKGKHPWLAAFMYRRKSGHGYFLHCGGSLINKRFVLTTATCLQIGIIAKYRVLLGTGLIAQHSDCNTNAQCAPHMQNLTIKEILLHPFFHKSYALNDIALVRLGRDVKFDDYVSPVCLPPLNLQPLRTESSSKVIVAGWEWISNSDRHDVNITRKAESGVWDARIYFKDPNWRAVHKQEFCTPTLCLLAKPGGPIVRAHKDQRGQNLFLEGIYLGRSICRRHGFPLYNTNIRISAFTSWIVGTIANTRNIGY